MMGRIVCRRVRRDLQIVTTLAHHQKIDLLKQRGDPIADVADSIDVVVALNLPAKIPLACEPNRKLGDSFQCEAMNLLPHTEARRPWAAGAWVARYLLAINA